MPMGNTDEGSTYRNSFVYLLILLAGAVIAYWPVAFNVLSLKNDALNYFLPVRRLVSESYHHHIFPLWTPYMNLGYPLHGDMQSGVWNPIVQLFSLFGPYTLYTLQLETVLYVYLSGVGMFFLLKYFRVHPYANLLASFAYMLCGFASDSGQYLNWISGLSFLPFVFLFYYRCLHEKTWETAMYTATALFFLFACAYPADFIITLYLMLAMFIWYLITEYRESKKITRSKQLFVTHAIIIFIFILLSAPSIISYAQTLPLTERGTGANYEDVMSNPLHPALLSAYTTPFAIEKMPGASITDGLERNSYIGLIGFILLITAYFTKYQGKIISFSKYATIIFLLFSFGEMGGLRVMSYYLLPLMDTFRHPANAKMFTIFFSCLLVGFTFHQVIHKQLPKKSMKKGFVSALGLAVVVLIFSLTTPLTVLSPGSVMNLLQTTDGVQFRQHLKDYLDKMSFADFVVLNTIIQLPFFYLAWLWLIKKPSPKYLLITAIVNSILFTIFFQPLKVVRNERASVAQTIIDNNVVNGYPLPDPGKSPAENSLNGMKYFDEMGTLNVYNKKVGRVDYRISPCNLLSQNEFWFDKPFQQLVMNYPLLYKTDSAVDMTAAVNIENLPAGKKYVFVTRSSLRDSINKYISERTPSVSVQAFNPTYFKFGINSSEPAYYVLLQNHFPLWKVTINGITSPPEKVNKTFMGFTVPPGNHTVEFSYDSGLIIPAWWISLVSLILILAYSLTRILHRPNKLSDRNSLYDSQLINQK